MTGKNSTDVYARDVLAAPLREFEQVLHQSGNGSLRPDATRSGMVGPESTENQNMYLLPEQIDSKETSDVSSYTSSESDGESEAEHTELAMPLDTIAAVRSWDPDFDMYQRNRSQIGHVDHHIQPALDTANGALSYTIQFYESSLWQAQLNFRRVLQEYLRYYGRLPSLDVHARHGG